MKYLVNRKTGAVCAFSQVLLDYRPALFEIHEGNPPKANYAPPAAVAPETFDHVVAPTAPPAGVLDLNAVDPDAEDAKLAEDTAEPEKVSSSDLEASVAALTSEQDAHALAAQLDITNDIVPGDLESLKAQLLAALSE